MSSNPKVFLTPEQYLEIERKAEFKSEYYNGEMFAMSGAKLGHNRLVRNLIRELGTQLRRGPCEVLPSDMRVRVDATGLYTYPDVVAFCGAPQLADSYADTLLNPSLIIEVLSPSTEAYDRGAKFEQYQTIGSLSEYLLVSSVRVRVDLYSRQPDGRWILSSADRLDQVIELASIGCRLSLADLYEGIDL